MRYFGEKTVQIVELDTLEKQLGILRINIKTMLEAAIAHNESNKTYKVKYLDLTQKYETLLINKKGIYNAMYRKNESLKKENEELKNRLENEVKAYRTIAEHAVVLSGGLAYIKDNKHYFIHREDLEKDKTLLLGIIDIILKNEGKI